MVLLVLQLQPQWLRRTELLSFLQAWRGLAAELLGLLFVVFLLGLVLRMALVSGMFWAFVVELLGKLLALALG